MHDESSEYEEQFDTLKEELRETRDLVVEEDKSTVDGYERYITGDGGMMGAMMATAADTQPDVTILEADKQFGFDIVLAAQVADDIYDDDIGLSREGLRKRKKQAIQDLQSHDGVMPKALSVGARLYEPFLGVVDRLSA